MHAVQTILLLLIAGGVAYIAYRLYRGGSFGRENDGFAPAAVRAGVSTETGADGEGPDKLCRQLVLYREVVRLLTRIGQDGDITKHELADFRASTHEAGFLFDRETAGYVEEIYQRALKLEGTNRALKDARLSIGEERDAITLENSRQLIWLADQLPQLHKRFGKYLSPADLPPSSGK